MSLLALACAITPILAQQAAPSAPARDPVESDGFVSFSFSRMEIRAFVEYVGKMTGRKFVIGDKVTGTVTVVSPLITRKEVFPLFVSILESSGYTVVRSGDVYSVVPLPERPAPSAPVIGSDEGVPDEGLITKVIHLINVTADQVARVLEALSGGKAGTVGVVEETNHLVITDTASNIQRIQQIIREIDRPGLARSTEVVPVLFANAQELAVELSVAVAGTQTEADRLKDRLPSTKPGREGETPSGAVVVASPHSNSILLVGTPSQLQQIKELLKKMDVDAPMGRGRFNAIFLKYLSATEAATNLNALLSKIPADQAATRSRSISVEASVANNALIVDASPGDFDVIRKLIEQLDKLPEQVHVTVLIAEVTASTNNTFGVEMVGLDAPEGVGDTAFQGASQFEEGSGSLMDSVQQGLFPRGLSFGVAQGSSLDAEGNLVVGYPGIINIDAVKARGRFEVLSETALEVQNNKEASVSIVSEIPILASTIQGGSGTSRDVIQNLDRVDVGIKLSLTPHIIPGGEVQMVLNPKIEAVTDEGQSGAYAPTIAKREVSTTVTVKDGATIVIAGLTRTDKSESEERVPILGSIPLIGSLFRRSTDSIQKTDLLIFVTPRVVSARGEGRDEVMTGWLNKTELPVNGSFTNK